MLIISCKKGQNRLHLENKGEIEITKIELKSNINRLILNLISTLSKLKT